MKRAFGKLFTKNDTHTLTWEKPKHISTGCIIKEQVVIIQLICQSAIEIGQRPTQKNRLTWNFGCILNSQACLTLYSRPLSLQHSDDSAGKCRNFIIRRLHPKICSISFPFPLTLRVGALGVGFVLLPLCDIIFLHNMTMTMMMMIMIHLHTIRKIYSEG